MRKKNKEQITKNKEREITEVIELDEDTDRLQVKIFNGNRRSAEREVNAWLREGKKKVIINYGLGVYAKKSSFSGGGEEEIFYLVYHYKLGEGM